MFSLSPLLASVLLALSIAATPVVQLRDLDPSVALPFALRFNHTGVNMADADRARAAEQISWGKQMEQGNVDVNFKRASSISVTNTAVTYVASVDVGSPSTSYTLLIDTGSSNTWVGAGKAYKKTSTSVNSGKQVKVSYGSGSFSGTEYTDTVSFSSSLVISKQSIGVASTAKGFGGVDGILGIGPVALTQGTVSGMSTVPTVTDNLFTQKKISTEVIGISYNPTTSASSKNGELTFGGVDSSKYTGSISYVPITSTSPARYYWGIDQSITYGSSKSNVLSKTSGIVDTGTTLTLIATDAFKRYVQLTGAVMDSSTGLLRLTSAQFSKLQSMYFTIGGTTYEFTANAQIWPRSLNSYIGGSSGNIYLIVGDLGSNSGQGLDFINGFTFLERFYSVYDTTNNRVGLATTSNTRATSN